MTALVLVHGARHGPWAWDALVPRAQEIMSARAERVPRLDTSHSPFLSRPAEVATLMRAEMSIS